MTRTPASNPGPERPRSRLGLPRPRCARRRPRRPDRLAEALRRLAGRERARPPAHDLAARLDYLERDASEVRTRINALFFAVIAVVLGEILSRVLAA